MPQSESAIESKKWTPRKAHAVMATYVPLCLKFQVSQTHHLKFVQPVASYPPSPSEDGTRRDK
jgi:hypothetical protein